MDADAPRPGHGRWLGGLAILFLPVAVWLYWASLWAPGPVDVVALDHALVGREMAAGRGFSSPVATPLHLRVAPDLERADPVFARPVPAAWLALWFRLTGATTEKVVVLAAGMFFVVTAWLVFALAVRTHTREAAWVCFLVFVLNPRVLDLCTSGRPEAMGMFLVALLFYWLDRSKPLPAAPLPVKACFRSGVAAGLLTQTGMFVALPLLLLVPLLWFRWGWMGEAALAGGRGGWFDRYVCRRMVRAFVTGALLPVALVWAGRLFVTGEAPVSVDRYLLAVNTSVSMGWSYWREFVLAEPDLLAFFAQFMPSVGLKWLAGLSYGFHAVFEVFTPVISALFVFALFFPEHGEDRGFRWLLLGLVALHIAVMALFYWDGLLLAVWSPLIILCGAGTFSDFLQQRFTRLRAERAPGPYTLIRLREDLRLYYLPLLLLLVLTAGALPIRTFDRRPPARPEPSAAMARLAEDPARYEWIVTPAPWLVAWHTGARTLWMPEMEHQMAAIGEQLGDRLATVFLPRNRAEILHDELPAWWYFALRQRDRLPGYGLAAFSGYGEAVYLRRGKGAEPGARP